MKPDMTKIPKLGIENMSVGYNGKALISEICLSLAPGEILTLIGPNGAGKSTILKSITRHLSLIAGTVYIDGRDMKQMSGKDVATRLAVVLTERVHAEMMTCEELVSAGRYPYTGSFGLLTARDKEIVRHALEQVHALDIAEQEVTSLSDGQRQRILLARAICQEPEIIVLDEPTSFLDIRHKIELLEILHSMAREQGITVVMSLHEIDLAERISDKIVCVKGDRIAAWGTPREIFSDKTIRELYGIEKGSFNTLLGSIEMEKPAGAPRCFVVGGGGTGIPFYRALQKEGVPFAAGILLGNDLDRAVAEALSDSVVCAESFAPIGEKEIARARDLVEAVDTVIDCGCPAGELNRANTELLKYAESRGKRILRGWNELTELMQ